MTIRILHVIDSLGVGGAEKQLLKTVLHMDRNTFVHHVCHVYGSSTLASGFEKEGIPVHCLSPDGKRNWLKEISRLVALIRKIRPDIVHTYLFNGHMIGRPAGFLTGRTTVSSFTNTNYDPVRSDLEGILWWKLQVVRLADMITARLFADRFVAVTPFVAKSMSKHLGIKENKIKVILRGLDSHWGLSDPNTTPPDLREHTRSHFPVLLNVGRLVPAKGHVFALKAIQLLKAKYPKIILLLAGDGVLRKSLVEMSKELGIEHQVVFLGTRHDVDKLLAASDIFVFPSLYEGAANAIVEAAGMGKPCVAFDIPNLKGIVLPDFCRFATLGDAGSFATAIDDLCANRSRWNDMGLQARSWVKDHFSISAVARDYEKYYQEVLKCSHE